MGNPNSKEKDGDYRVRYRSWRLGNKDGAKTGSSSDVVDKPKLLRRKTKTPVPMVPGEVKARAPSLTGTVEGSASASAAINIEKPLIRKSSERVMRNPNIMDELATGEPINITSEMENNLLKIKRIDSHTQDKDKLVSDLLKNQRNNKSYANLGAPARGPVSGDVSPDKMDVPRAKSTNNLDQVAVFPKNQKKPHGNRNSLNEAVLEQLCDAVTMEMVGAHYSMTPSGKILNHLYKPVYESVMKHLRRMPKKYSLSVSHVEVAVDLRLLAEVTRDPSTVAVHTEPSRDEHGREIPSEYCVCVVGRDRRSFLDTVTRILSTRSSITHADITTTNDGFVLDRFICVQDENEMALEPQDIKREIEHYLGEASSLSPITPMYAAQYPRSPPTPPGGTSPPTAQQSQPQPPQQATEVKNDNNPTVPAAATGTAAAAATTTTPPSKLQSIANRIKEADTNTKRAAETGISVDTPDDAHAPWEVAYKDIIFIKVIGQGRSGKMYLADLNGQKVAAKTMDLSRVSGPDNDALLGEFYREVTIVSKLRHPNICMFIGVAIQEPNFVTLFELLSGGSLAQVLRQNSQYSFFKLAMNIARGMAYLHSNHVMHRDLKSDNILLDEHGTAKIVDFGLSCFAGSNLELTAETGTYRWMAPEVIRHEPYALSADVYSYGIVLWELLSRQQPYAGMTPVQAAFAVARQNMRPRLPSYVPKSVATLIKQCWSQNPQVRPTFDSILVSLETILRSLKKSDREMLDCDSPKVTITKKATTSSVYR